MDIQLRDALRNFRLGGDPTTALALVKALDRSGLLPDSPGQDRPHPLTCNLDDLGNATAHLTIGDTNLLLFHKTVVGVQVNGQPAVINPEWSTSPTTRKRIREWPGARHVIETTRGVDRGDFNDLIRFKRV